MQISRGEVGLLKRTRTKPRAVEYLLQVMAERMQGHQTIYVAVLHTNVPGEAEKLRAEVASRFNCTELYVTEFTPVMGTHTGPGLLGLAFYSDG
jgi:fatty acid-binding protein DegV